MIAENNPGNIRISSQTWQGQLPPEVDDQFCRFDTPVNGLRAILKILMTYQDKHGFRTIRGWIYRWAPPSDHNPTAAYVQNVAAACGVGVDDCVDIRALPIALGCLRGIVKQENGQQPYGDATLMAACAAVGILPPQDRSGVSTAEGAE